MNMRIIRVPTIKYNEAKNYQKILKNNNSLNLPLWACLVEQEKNKNDRKFKRFI